MNEVGAAECSISQDKAQGSVQRDSQTLSFLSRLWVRLSPLLPLLFVIGWFLCRDFLGDDERFLFASLLAGLSTAVLVFVLRRPIEGMFPLIILLTIFLIGYYIKFYWLVLTLDAGDEQTVIKFLVPYRHRTFLPLLRPQNILRTFELSTWGYVAFCAGAVVSIGLGLAPRSLSDLKLPESARILNKLRVLNEMYLAIAFGIWLATVFLTYRLGIGIHGRQNVPLPFKLTGIIRYMSELPAMFFIFVVMWSDRRGMRIYWWAGLMGLIGTGLSTIFLRGSRGALVSEVVAPLGTVWLLYRRFTRKRVIFLIVLFVIVMLLRPAFTVYRQLRANPYTNQGFTQMMVRAYQSGGTGELFESFMRIVIRVVGVDSMLYVAPVEPRVEGSRIVSVLLGQHILSRELTVDIQGYPPSSAQYSAPSLVGGLYLMGATVGIVAGVFAITVISQWIWERSCGSRWWTVPLVLARVTGLVFTYGLDGKFESLLREIFVTAVFLVGLEFMSRVRL
jgi:hypothetical protein